MSILCIFSSCEDYLDLKPDKKQVVPATLKDAQSLLNNVDILSGAFPAPIEISADDYYLTSEVWNSQQPWDREAYIWQEDANIFHTAWSTSYNKVLVANQVLAILEGIQPSSQEQAQWNRLKGAALLFRALSFYTVAQLFAQPFDASTAAQEMGIPIRLSPSLSEATERGTLLQTYEQIIQDLTEAVALLPSEQPVSPVSKTIASPVRAAALGALARVYLSMEDYDNALMQANACLQEYDVLIDYRDLDTTITFTIPRFNEELIFFSFGPGTLPILLGNVNSELYQSYNEGDLRKSVFFLSREDGTYRYRGTFEVNSSISTDEMYLIRAECAARAGNTAAAMMDLNTLLSKRWDNTFIPLVAANADVALELILEERRKELCFRGFRWIDLRRLNKDSRFAVTLTRNLDGKVYVLPPNDLRYTFLIPLEVLERVDIPQNPR